MIHFTKLCPWSHISYDQSQEINGETGYDFINYLNEHAALFRQPYCIGQTDIWLSYFKMDIAYLANAEEV